MPSNFNTAPTSAPELGSAWNYGTSISHGIPDMPSGPRKPDWGDAPTATADAASGWEVTPADSMSFTPAELNVVERLRNLKDKVVHGMGRKALDAVMNRLPGFSGKDAFQTTATNMYEDPTARQNIADGWSDMRTNAGSYREQAGQFARGAGREVAGAGVTAAKEAVMNYYGLEKDENEKLRVARKLKFGKAVVKTVMNPLGTASSVGVRAGRASWKASKQEGFSQLKSAHQNFNVTPVAEPSPYAGW